MALISPDRSAQMTSVKKLSVTPKFFAVKTV